MARLLTAPLQGERDRKERFNGRNPSPSCSKERHQKQSNRDREVWPRIQRHGPRQLSSQARENAVKYESAVDIRPGHDF
jgi:hypothetical protein